MENRKRIAILMGPPALWLIFLFLLPLGIMALYTFRAGTAERRADLVLLVKPQFEVGKAEASRGKGVIRDPAVREAALTEVRSALAERRAVIMGEMVSPLKGGAGNVEYLLHVQAPA